MEPVYQQKSTATGTSKVGYKQELRRVLSLKDLIIYGLITMLPIAPVQIYGLIAHESFGMVPLVYLVGVIAMVFTATSYSTMSKEFPTAGSTYSYVQREWNPHIGFLAGWLIIIDYMLVPALLTWTNKNKSCSKMSEKVIRKWVIEVNCEKM